MDSKSRLIKEIRAQLKLGQAELAKELGVSFATVNRWENGHFTPSPVALRALKQLCRERGIDFEQYEDNYRDTADTVLTLYSADTRQPLDEALFLDCYEEGFCHAEENGVLFSAKLVLEAASILYLTNAADFLFLNAFRRGILKKSDAPERYARCEALIEGCDIVITYGITRDLSALITRFYEGEITDRALGACLSLCTVGQGYLLISRRAKEALLLEKAEPINSEAIRENKDLQAILKKYRRDGYYFDEILDAPTL